MVLTAHPWSSQKSASIVPRRPGYERGPSSIVANTLAAEHVAGTRKIQDRTLEVKAEEVAKVEAAAESTTEATGSTDRCAGAQKQQGVRHPHTVG